MFLPVIGNSIKYRVPRSPELMFGLLMFGILVWSSLIPSSIYARAFSRFLSLNLAHSVLYCSWKTNLDPSKHAATRPVAAIILKYLPSDYA
jgi:hypothetical protein